MRHFQPINNLYQWALGIGTSMSLGAWIGYRKAKAYPLDPGIIRTLRAASVVAKVSMDYRFTDRELYDEVHERSAKSLLRLAQTNKGVYIKIGQHASSLDYLLPPIYIETFRVLLKDAPCSAFTQIEKLLKSEFKIKKLDEVFEEFNPIPQASASLAQVHFAKLKNTGESVAVKVQHPEVGNLAEIDTKTIRFLVNIASRIFPEAKFDWLSESVDKNLPEELNFIQEARNAEKLSAILATHSPIHFSWEPLFIVQLFSQIKTQLLIYLNKINSQLQHSKPLLLQSLYTQSQQTLPSCNCNTQNVSTIDIQKANDKTNVQTENNMSKHPYNFIVDFHVPKVYWQATTKKVLTMERCSGVHVNNIKSLQKNGIEPIAVSRAISELFCRLIFEDGFVHADPHPGNLLVQRLKTDDTAVTRLQLSLLDHGLYCEVDKEFRFQYSSFWQGAIYGDWQALKQGANYFGVPHLAEIFACVVSGRIAASVNRGLSNSNMSESEMCLIPDLFLGNFVEITQVLHGVPRELLMILKTNDLTRSLHRQLGSTETLALIPSVLSSFKVTAERQLSLEPNFVKRLKLAIYVKCVTALIGYRQRLFSQATLRKSHEKC